MKKNNTQKKSRPFDAEIKQMRKEHVILMSLVKVKPFVAECTKRHIPVACGSVYKDGIIMFEQK